LIGHDQRWGKKDLFIICKELLINGTLNKPGRRITIIAQTAIGHGASIDASVNNASVFYDGVQAPVGQEEDREGQLGRNGRRERRACALSVNRAAYTFPNNQL
jgi:hypothetical protein